MTIDRLANRARLYAFEDGTVELSIGLVCLAAGSAFQLARPPYLLIAPAIWLCSTLCIAWGAKTLKERVTSPRGGYVAFDEQVVTARGRISRRLLNVALTFGMVAFIAVFRDLFNFPGSVTLGASACFFGAYIYDALKYRIMHMVWLAGYTAALGAWAYARHDSLTFVIAGQGVALTAAGSASLWRFLKSHPKPTGPEI